MKSVPENAKKLFEGIIFDVYQWEQEQFDGSFKTFECIKRLDVSVIIPVFQDKILVIQEQQPGREPYWCLPAGRFSRTETDPLEVAKRELKEEIGAEARTWELFDSYDRGGTTAVGMTHVYIARECEILHIPNPDIGGEILHDMKYVTYDEFLDLYKQEAIESGVLESTMLRALLHPDAYDRLKKKIFG